MSPSSQTSNQKSLSPSAKRVGAKPRKEGEIPDPFSILRKPIEKIRPKNALLQWGALLAFSVLVLAALTFVWNKEFVLPVVFKLTLTIVLLTFSGELMRGWMDWDGFFGLILFKDRSMLGWVDRQAQKYKTIWNVIADLGLVIGYGLCGYFLLSPSSRKPARLAALYAAGIPLLFIFSFVLSQLAIGVLMGLITQTDTAAGADMGLATQHAKAGLESVAFFKTVLFDGAIFGFYAHITVLGAILFALLIVGGLAATTTISILAYALMIFPGIMLKLAGIIVSIATGAQDVSVPAPPPGGAPIIPFFTIPLVEGILALAIVLMVHEMMHGFLARISKVRLDSAGLAFYSVLPFGAFVEPDEKELDKVSKHEVNRVMVAGVASNFVVSVLLCALMLGLLASTASLRLEGWRVVSGPLPEGSVVYSINNQPILPGNNSFAPNSMVSVNTSQGMFERPTNASGKIGIMMDHVPKDYVLFAPGPASFKFQYAPGFEWLGLVIRTIGLAFALNLLVGMVNLLPIQIADGYRLVENLVGNKTVAKIIAWSVLAAFVINFLPWLFR